MPKYFVDKSNIKDGCIIINNDENVHHIKNVMRAKIGMEIYIGDKENNNYKCSISEIDKESLTLKIIENIEIDVEPAIDVVLFASIIKGEKMEWVIQKAVELGVAKIIPMITKHCVVKIESEKKAYAKVERWNKIAESAAKQSGRGITVEIANPIKLNEALKLAKDNLDANVIPYEKENAQTYKSFLCNTKMKSLGIFIGPEGGFATEEIELAEQFGVIPVTLGKIILRSETASIASVAIAIYETNN
ncbi:MAG: hypothetical protein ATN31_07380 [Candidatus Epulonipiscioides saccharophilum]|nr:MAG: hypothetical protein ATN31_07380 [Epulopiscium sp. AS2M-Bin001]